MSVTETLNESAGAALVGRTAWVPSAGQVAVVPYAGQQCPGGGER